MPLTTFQLPDLLGSGECASCHTALFDTAGNDVSRTTHWRSAMMAGSGKDPLWQAKVASEVQRDSPVGVFGGGFLNPTNGYHAAAMHGVSCALCHPVRAEKRGWDFNQ